MGDDVVVGVVVKPFGLHGDAYVQPDPDLDYDFVAGEEFRTADGRVLRVAAAHDHSGRILLRFEGYEDRTAAEALRGVTLLVDRDDFELEADAFWTADLLGREVVDADGAVVGVLEAVRDGVAHDYFVVARPDGGELLVPVVSDLVEVTETAIVIRVVEED